MRMALDLNVPEWVLCDATRLRQILLNLLSNAIKFTEIGAVTIQAEVADTAAEGCTTLRLTIRDTGIGMDDATLARLFKRFSQGTVPPCVSTAAAVLAWRYPRAWRN